MSFRLRNTITKLNLGVRKVVYTVQMILLSFESALKSLKKDGTISHRLFEERKDYISFIEDKRKQGVNPKAAHLDYFKNLL